MLVLVSVDGLRPELYLGYPGLRSRCAYAEAVRPVYPSLTYTNHATLVTGVSSSVHGITANTRFRAEDVSNWVGGESKDWHFDSRAIRVPTLWDVAEASGHSVALLRWPTTLGARATWLVPEIFPVGVDDPWDQTWSMTRETSRIPGFDQWLQGPAPRTYPALDEKVTELALALIAKRAPDVMLIHLNALDHVTHECGIDSHEVGEIAGHTAKLVLKILAAMDLSRDQLLIVGDHGFSDFSHRAHINALLARGGWLKARDGKIEEWSAVAHTSCAQAAVFIRDASRTEELLAYLRSHQSNVYRVLSRDRLKQLGAFPDAVCAIDAREGFSMGQGLEGAWITRLPKLRSEHGYLPDYPAMHTGFIAAGKQIMSGLNLGLIDIRSITPTVCSLLKIRLLGEMSPMDLMNAESRPLGRTIPL